MIELRNGYNIIDIQDPSTALYQLSFGCWYHRSTRFSSKLSIRGFYLALRNPDRWAASLGPTVIVQPGSSSSTSPAMAAA